MSVSIRRFTSRDLPAVAVIERVCFRRYAWPAEYLSSYAAAFPDLFLVAIVEGRIVGYSAVVLARGWAELVSIAVLPGFRGRGIARTLLKAILHRLRRQRIAGLSLMVRTENRRAQRLYTRFGFSRIRVVARYYEDGGDGVRMRIRLKGNHE